MANTEPTKIAAQKYQKLLPKLMRKIEDSHVYFRENCARYHSIRNFVYQSNLSASEKSTLDNLKRPALEFNLCSAYLSRLLGEFSKQEPSFMVQGTPTEKPAPTQLLECIEGKMEEIREESKTRNDEYEIYKDQLSGGFGVMKIWTDYENPTSFHKCIKYGRVTDPTLCGFDPLATDVHKGDAEYYWEVYPKTAEEFKDMGYGIDLETVKSSSKFGDIAWSYNANGTKIIIICDIFVKKRKKFTLCQLSDGRSMSSDDYDNLDVPSFTVKPTITGTRQSTKTIICFYQLINGYVLKYSEIDIPMIPRVFFDGDSIKTNDTNNVSANKQFTRPYILNAIDSQRLLNLTGQTIANDFENMTTSKFMLGRDVVNPSDLDAWRNPQQASALLYNTVRDDGSPNVPPQQLMHMPLPPEIPNMFGQLNQTINSILGSFNVSMENMNAGQLSGLAIVEGATLSNAVDMPYIVNFLAGLNQVAQVILHLMPKVYTGKRLVPYIAKDGKHAVKKVNYGTQDSVSMNYDPYTLNVTVKAGINFELQQSRALQAIISLSQAVPAFGELINTMGLPVIVDNLNIKGADQLKEMAQKFTQMQQQKMQQAQGQQPPSPQMLKAQADQAKTQAHVMTEQQWMQIEKDKNQLQADNERLRILLEASTSDKDRQLQSDKLQTERAVHGANIHLKAKAQEHSIINDAMQHVKDIADTLNQSQQSMQPGQQQPVSGQPVSSDNNTYQNQNA
jgi:hypothetical protein